MALRIEDKKAIVAEVAEQVSSALSAAVADYRGLTVNEMTSLREEARKSGVYLRVVRNNLARLAVKGTEFECLADALKGPLVLALSMESPGGSAKLFKNFSKDHKALEVKNLVMAGDLYGPEKLDDFAKIPTRDEAIAILMSVMQAPVTKLARTLNEVQKKQAEQAE
ncbi:50S ribosomal protein L10 [Candidatus Francisella endociliophora]|uniref:Large ribosomal subunit protein uL10 n=1 Tax=Candidatus Francisella endociliophora TaxID=653937 RepID=A0A097EPB8_9GAMM|nr:50S ribosomal protein L10 [Francisella sp. FSC1006]AIT09408.1 50S ribosomal protein L10 [Francisella sp. FSC1006]